MKINTKNVQAVIKCSADEQHFLWCQWARDSPYLYKTDVVENGIRVSVPSRQHQITWIQQGIGFWTTIGTINDRPICVGVTFAEVGTIRLTHEDLCRSQEYIQRKLKGEKLIKIAFVDGQSQLVDHKMIDEWIDTEMPQTKGHHSNAMNFFNAFSHIK